MPNDLISSAIIEIEEHTELDFNETQKEFWEGLLSSYSEEILTEGWDDFISILRPRIKPSGQQAKQVFGKVVLRKEYLPPKEVDIQTKRYGSLVARAVINSISYAKQTEGGKAAYHSDQSRFWKKIMKEPNMAKKHARLAREETRGD